MSTRADNLSLEKIRQLLAAAGVESQDDPSRSSAAQAFDWRCCRYFTLAQLARVNQFAETAAAACTDLFSRLYQGDCTVSVISTRQYFSSAPQADSETGDYFLPFGSDAQKPFGMLRIPQVSALTWAGMMLGGTVSGKETDRSLSRLEESFLADIASGLIDAFARAYGAALQAGGAFVRDRSTVALRGSEERLEIVFQAEKTDSPESALTAAFLVCCDKLETVAGKTASAKEKPSEAQIRSAMLGHIHQVPMSVRVELGTVMVAFKDVVNLQANDVLVLHKRVSEPVDVLVDERVLFKGHPVQSGGRQAVILC